ncbi:MAG: substrate-binding domain-containing protein [Desulfobacterales bacterium]|nr:MAG: substrate-binding domain-containing protein [Desulfobacterales bacterium]
MRGHLVIVLAAIIGFLPAGAIQPNCQAAAGPVLRYSSSAQVREALGEEGLNEFTRETGVEVDLFVGSSRSAVHRLMNGFSDIASTVERLHPGHQKYGYEEIPFCTAPLVVIAHKDTPIDDITETQLREIFSGNITTWKDLGGPDQTIVVVVPEKSTGAYSNFRQLALKMSDIKYDFMAYRSTDVVKMIKSFPGSISFITQGALTINQPLKTLKINGLSPAAKDYPYHQTFSWVTKGEPAGAAKQLVDFSFSEKAQGILQKNGMKPLAR